MTMEPTDPRRRTGPTATPTRTPVPPTATPLAGSLNTDTELMIGLKSGQISYEEVAGRYGKAKADQLMLAPVTASQQATINRIKAEIAAGATPQSTVSPATNNGAPVGTDWQAVTEAYDTGAPIGNYGAVSNAGTTSAGQTATSSSGNPYQTAVSAAKASSQPATPAMNTALDLQNRGAIPVGSGIAVLNGQQYLRLHEARQADDGLWYNVNPNEPTAPLGQGYKSQSQALANAVYTQVGPAVTARNMNLSPLARAASLGGMVPQVENPAFNVNSIDQMVRAGAQRGMQSGDIITTVRPNASRTGNLEVTEGGIPSYGGLMPIRSPSDGQMQSYTGQLPGNVSIGMSSPVAGNHSQDLYWLQQSLGLPISEMGKIANLNEAQILRMQEAAGDLRAQGFMPDLNQLWSNYEPAGPITDRWSSGQQNSTPYDQAWDAFYEYALGQDPNLTFLPQVDPMANRSGVYDYDGSLLTFANGGDMVLDEPAVLTGLRSKRPLALMGEAGEQEMISMGNGQMEITPMGMPQSNVRLGREGGFRNRFDGLLPEMAPMPQPFQSIRVPRVPMPQMPTRDPQMERFPQVRPNPRPPLGGLLAGLLPQSSYQFPAPFSFMNTRQPLPSSIGGVRLFAEGGKVLSGYKGGFSSQYDSEDSPYSPADKRFVSTRGSIGVGGAGSYVRYPQMYTQGTTQDGMYIPGAEDIGIQGRIQFGGDGRGRRQLQDDATRANLGMISAPIGYQPLGTMGAVPVYQSQAEAGNADLQLMVDEGVGQWINVPTTLNGRPAYIRTFDRYGSGRRGPVTQNYGNIVEAGLKNLLTGEGGMGGNNGGVYIDPLLEAQDKRYYDTQLPNYRAAGLPGPAILNLEEFDDEGKRYYRKYDGALPNGMRLPFGYDPNGRTANSGSLGGLFGLLFGRD